MLLFVLEKDITLKTFVSSALLLSCCKFTYVSQNMGPLLPPKTHDSSTHHSV